MDTKYYYMMGLPASGKTTFLVAFTYMLLEQTEKVCLHMKPQDVQEGLTEEFKKEIERWTNFESLHHTGVERYQGYLLMEAVLKTALNQFGRPLESFRPAFSDIGNIQDTCLFAWLKYS